MLVTCDNCGKLFQKKAWQVKATKHNFCSRGCLGEYRRKKTIIPCGYCGKEFEIETYRVDKARNHFCSKECFKSFQSKVYKGAGNPSWAGGKVTVICTECGKKFGIGRYLFKTAKDHFCSLECMGNFYSKNHRGVNHPSWRGGKVKVTCDMCGKKIKKNPSQLRGKHNFCSLKCMGKWRSLYTDIKQRAKEMRKKARFPHYYTKPEEIFLNISKGNNIPVEFTGNGALWIGKKGGKQLNPDFIIKINGKRYAVEAMGDYWHSPLLNRSLKKGNILSYREKFYKNQGWHPIFIWESDLKRKDAEAFVLNVLAKNGIIVAHTFVVNEEEKEHPLFEFVSEEVKIGG